MHLFNYLLLLYFSLFISLIFKVIKFFYERKKNYIFIPLILENYTRSQPISTSIDGLDFQISRNNKRFPFKISHYYGDYSVCYPLLQVLQRMYKSFYWSHFSMWIASPRWTIKVSKLQNDHTPSKPLYLFNGYLLFYFHLQTAWKQKVSR